MRMVAADGIPGEQLESRSVVELVLRRVEHVEHRLLCRHHRSEFREDELADGQQILLTLEHA